MNENLFCSYCGRPLPETGVLDGRCPRCLIERALESTTGFDRDETVEFAPREHDDDVARRSHPRSIGRYTIHRMVGEGGMGIVYEAEQEYPRRTVALKNI